MCDGVAVDVDVARASVVKRNPSNRTPGSRKGSLRPAPRADPGVLETAPCTWCPTEELTSGASKRALAERTTLCRAAPQRTAHARRRCGHPQTWKPAIRSELLLRTCRL